eukprot:scaffold132421_cov37-Attheya_sp.AAC.7
MTGVKNVKIVGAAVCQMLLLLFVTPIVSLILALTTVLILARCSDSRSVSAATGVTGVKTLQIITAAGVKTVKIVPAAAAVCQTLILLLIATIIAQILALATALILVSSNTCLLLCALPASLVWQV